MVTLILLNPQTHTPLQQWNFRNQSVIRIGRRRDNDIVLDQSLEVSRHHLELRKVDNSKEDWQILSRGTNGTFVNGRLVSQGLVTDNALIQLAKEGPLLKFQLQSDPATEQSNSHSQNTLPGTCTHPDNPPNNLFCIHCGQPLVEKEEFIRHYQILRTLGQGGMGTTYLAWDKTGTTAGVPRLLVLKEMNADMVQIAKARELFEREARILKSLNHPGIPKYYDFFLENDKKYLAMGLVHGQNLEQRIYKKGPVIPQQAIEWMIQSCDILHYLHSLDPPLVHRDVKPANLIIRNLDNHVVLLDFGAVKEIGTPPGTRIGAEGYSAPEQDRGQPCPQSDIYAIGSTLIFLLAGEAPFKYYRRQGAEYKFDVRNIPNITSQLSKVIEKACEPKLGDRYQCAQELSQALAACLSQ
ncbi:MAG: protein kinase [Xenococcaceae cyanobacterium]